MRLNIIDNIQLAVSGCRTYSNQEDFDAKMNAWTQQTSLYYYRRC
jgi:hypothetical protein